MTQQKAPTLRYHHKAIQACEGLSFGTSAGNDIVLPDDPAILDIHARTRIIQGELHVVVEHRDHPIFDEDGNPQLRLRLSKHRFFRIGSEKIGISIEVGRDSSIDNHGPGVIEEGSHVGGLQPFFEKTVYRIGVIGTSGSGKTCLLTALAMHREANRKGYTCIRHKFLRAPKSASHVTKERLRKLEEEFSLGRKLLDDSVRIMESGKVPPNNEILDNVVPRFVFEFSTAERKNILVELIDYAGELVSPDLLVEKRAGRLLRLLRESDGVIILTEAPRVDSEIKEQSNTFNRLLQTFTMLKNVEDPPPIAVLVNKWDRRGSINYEIPESAQEDLKALINSDSGRALKSFIQTIEGMDNHSIEVWPVSAFGSHVFNPDTNEEYPAEVDPIPSFNLEDPIVSLIERAKTHRAAGFTRRLDKIETEISGLPDYFGKGEDLAKTQESIAELKEALSNLEIQAGTEPEVVEKVKLLFNQLECREKNHLKKKRLRKSLTWVSVLTIFMVMMFIIGDYLVYKHEFSHALKIEADESDRGKFERAVATLDAYHESAIYRHLLASLFIPSRDDAREQISNLKEQRKEWLRQTFQSARDKPEEMVGKASELRERIGEYEALTGTSDNEIVISLREKLDLINEIRRNIHALSESIRAANLSESNRLIGILRGRIDSGVEQSSVLSLESIRRHVWDYDFESLSRSGRSIEDFKRHQEFLTGLKLDPGAGGNAFSVIFDAKDEASRKLADDAFVAALESLGQRKQGEFLAYLNFVSEFYGELIQGFNLSKVQLITSEVNKAATAFINQDEFGVGRRFFRGLLESSSIPKDANNLKERITAALDEMSGNDYKLLLSQISSRSSANFLSYLRDLESVDSEVFRKLDAQHRESASNHIDMAVAELKEDEFGAGRSFFRRLSNGSKEHGELEYLNSALNLAYKEMAETDFHMLLMQIGRGALSESLRYLAELKGLDSAILGSADSNHRQEIMLQVSQAVDAFNNKGKEGFGVGRRFLLDLLESSATSPELKNLNTALKDGLKRVAEEDFRVVLAYIGERNEDDFLSAIRSFDNVDPRILKGVQTSLQERAEMEVLKAVNYVVEDPSRFTQGSHFFDQLLGWVEAEERSQMYQNLISVLKRGRTAVSLAQENHQLYARIKESPKLPAMLYYKRHTISSSFMRDEVRDFLGQSFTVNATFELTQDGDFDPTAWRDGTFRVFVNNESVGTAEYTENKNIQGRVNLSESANARFNGNSIRVEGELTRLVGPLNEYLVGGRNWPLSGQKTFNWDENPHTVTIELQREGGRERFNVSINLTRRTGVNLSRWQGSFSRLPE